MKVRRRLCPNPAHFVAPHFDAGANLVANLAHAVKPLLIGAHECGRIGKTPVQSRRHAGKDRTTVGAAFIANGDT